MFQENKYNKKYYVTCLKMIMQYYGLYCMDELKAYHYSMWTFMLDFQHAYIYRNSG